MSKPVTVRGVYKYRHHTRDNPLCLAAHRAHSRRFVSSVSVVAFPPPSPPRGFSILHATSNEIFSFFLFLASSFTLQDMNYRTIIKGFRKRPKPESWQQGYHHQSMIVLVQYLYVQYKPISFFFFWNKRDRRCRAADPPKIKWKMNQLKRPWLSYIMGLESRWDSPKRSDSRYLFWRIDDNDRSSPHFWRRYVFIGAAKSTLYMFVFMPKSELKLFFLLFFSLPIIPALSPW